MPYLTRRTRMTTQPKPTDCTSEEAPRVIFPSITGRRPSLISSSSLYSNNSAAMSNISFYSSSDTLNDDTLQLEPRVRARSRCSSSSSQSSFEESKHPSYNISGNLIAELRPHLMRHIDDVRNLLEANNDGSPQVLKAIKKMTHFTNRFTGRIDSEIIQFPIDCPICDDARDRITKLECGDCRSQSV